MLSFLKPYLSPARDKNHTCAAFKAFDSRIYLGKSFGTPARITLILCIVDPMWGCCHR